MCETKFKSRSVTLVRFNYIIYYICNTNPYKFIKEIPRINRVLWAGLLQSIKSMILIVIRYREEDELDVSANAVADLLKRNFNSHFEKRTPFGIYTHHSWFLTDAEDNNVKQQGFKK